MCLREVNKRELYLGIPIFIIYVFSLKFLCILKNITLHLDNILPFLFIGIFILETAMVLIPIYWIYIYFNNKRIIKETKDIREKLLITRVPYEVDLEDFFRGREKELKNGKTDNLERLKEVYLDKGE